jgi:type VI secretion system protein ImpL
MMRWVSRILGRIRYVRVPKWVWLVLGLLCIALLIWFVGPLVAIAKWSPLAGWIARTVVIAVMLLAVGGFYGWKRWKARKRNAEMMAELKAQPKPPPEPDLSEDDIKEMEERAAKALELMKSARVGKQREFVYELPWYIIIGPPGAGKTTALQNAGLQFPVAQELGAAPLRGIGGTTTTEWWFTDQAVLIDTAGRYTTQDSHQAADAKAWEGFLSLLKRFRPRQPVTGILVAISVTDLINGDESEATAHGRAVRQRINEISQKFSVRPPVYVLLTKMDLLAGFTEFFDDATASDRDQVWGHTFPIETSRSGDAAAQGFAPAFDGLVRRLTDRVLARVQAERDMARRGLIFGFPQQFAALRQPLSTLLQIIGRETKFEPTPLMRGFYFTSGTQFGRPIDRLLSSISGQFGLPNVPVPADAPAGRSYFLRHLLGEVVFKEGALAGQDPAGERKRRLQRLAVVGAGAAVVALFCVGWVYGYVRNASLVNQLQTRTAALQKSVAALPSGDLSDSDLMQVLPVLDQARNLPFASTAPKNIRSAGFSFGVGRTRALRPQVDGAYRNLLNRQLLPRLVLTLEDRLRSAVSDTGASDSRPAVYNLLRIYLMLGRAPGAPLEASQISTWFANDWADRFAGAEDDAARASLAGHLATLLQGPVAPPPLDRELIATARAKVTSLSPGERAYARLLADASLAEMPQFTLVGIPSVGTSGLFARRSGKSMSLGVPGMFRRDAFYSKVMPAIAQLATQSANEDWVTGAPAGGAARGVMVAAEVGRIKDGILVAYLKDFTAHWDAFIDDITISGERPVDERIRVAVQPPSPVKQLVNAIAKETDLSPPSIKSSGAAGAVRVAALFSRNIYRGQQRAQQIDSAMSYGPQGPPGPLDEVIEHFRWLRDMNPVQGPSPIDGALQALGALGDSAVAARTAAGMGDPVLQRSRAASAMEATARLDQVSAALPPVLGGMFTGFVRASTTQLNRSVNQNIQTQYAGQLRNECKAIVGQGYPFTAGERQVSIDDFSRLFRPGGLLDQFSQTNLAGMIDTSKPGWTLTQAGRSLGLKVESVRQLERADTIRRAFFQPGDIRPNVRFAMEPTEIEGAPSVALNIDGTPASFDAANRRSMELRWPGSAPGASVSFQSPGAAPSVRTWTGDWAFVRMISEGGVVNAGPRSVSFKTTAGTGTAGFSLRLLNTDGNPFLLNELKSFKCPDSL